jgi:hypothetical protein
MKPQWLSILMGAVLVVLTLVAAPRTVAADACTSKANTTWSTSTTWTCGHVPISGDSVTIATGTAVALDTSAPSSGGILSLTVQKDGVLTLGNNTTSRTLTVAGAVTVNSGGTLEANDPSTLTHHAMIIGGNLTNDGTFNGYHTNGRINVTFNGSGADQLVGGTSVAAFNDLKIYGKGDVPSATNAVVVIPITNPPTIHGIVTNNGTLKQTRTLGANTAGNFLNIATNKYYGVVILSGSTDLGVTTATVSGNQVCTSPVAYYTVKRCYTIVPANQVSRDIKFYYENSQMQTGQTYSNLNVWNYHNGTWHLVGHNGDAGSCAVAAINCYVQGNSISTYSPFALKHYDPAAVTLVDFSAAQSGDAIVVTWETATELNNRGFNLWRSTSPAGTRIKLNNTLIPSQSQGLPGSGFQYTWPDSRDLVPGTTYHYWLEDLDANGTLTPHEPVSVAYVSAPNWVGLVSFAGFAGASAAPGPALDGLAALALAVAALGGVAWRKRQC